MKTRAEYQAAYRERQRNKMKLSVEALKKLQSTLHRQSDKEKIQNIIDTLEGVSK